MIVTGGQGANSQYVATSETRKRIETAAAAAPMLFMKLLLLLRLLVLALLLQGVAQARCDHTSLETQTPNPKSLSPTLNS